MGEHAADPVHFDRELLIPHRLEHIIERADGVALDGVLGEHGDEDDRHVAVHRADLFRRVHTQHIRQLDVQEQDVRVAFILFQERDGAVIALEGIGKIGMVGRILFKHPAQALRLLLLVFQDHDVQHPAILPFRYRQMGIFLIIITMDSQFFKGSIVTGRSFIVNRLRVTQSGPNRGRAPAGSLKKYSQRGKTVVS